MKKYKVNKLIDGQQIDLTKGKTYVAVPDKLAGSKIEVSYLSTRMIINDWKEALMFKRFRDKYYTSTNGRKQFYTLGYFEYKPNEEQ